MSDLITRLQDEADRCRNEGAFDIAKLLDEAASELSEWRKLRDPVNLHVNLLRGLPAKLTTEQALHLAGEKYATDSARLDHLEQSHPHKSLRYKSKRWALVGFTNYKFSCFRSLREAIDSSMEESSAAADRSVQGSTANGRQTPQSY